MATWREVVSYLTSKYDAEQLNPTTMKLLFRFEDGRSQMVFVSGIALDHPEDAIVSFISPFAKTKQLSPQGLVDCMVNFNSLGIVIIDDHYALKNVAPLVNLDANEIEWPLAYVTEFADELERKLNLGDDL